MKIFEVVDTNNKNDFIKSFLPFVQQELNLQTLPEIKIVNQVPDTDGTTFGRYDNTNNFIYIVTQDRHPKDVLRTLAHELVHYQQGQQDRLHPLAGETGSEEENEANAQAGVLMRHYNEQNPE
jgi:Zn-dependent peptidase ImmA (M78 family)